VMTRSRAGLGLTIVALFGALALALIDRERLAKLTPTKILAGAVALAVVASTQYTLFRVIERFASDPVKDDRVLFARNTFEAAKAFMPFGSGVGTFVPVYALFERPEFALLDKYANRAHNDALEMWLETGLAGLLAFAIFVSWFASRAVIAWVRPNPDGLKVDHALARAATIAIVLILAHSAFDYPLRTNAMMAVFAFLCALLIAPPIGSESPAAVAAAAIEAEQRLSRPRQRREPVAGEPVAVRPDLAWPTQDTQPAEAAQEAQTARGARWGDAIEWPDEWRTNDQPGAARGSPPTKKP
jgi:O-antigen ligase